ncbi:MAG TPA: hypothetical protein VMV18_00405 [bacterium]|nr:hypothetical protein [bacterium]
MAESIATLRASRGALLPILAMVDGPKSPWLDPSWTSAADAVLAADATVAQLSTTLERLARIGAAVAQIPADEAERGDADRRRTRALRWLVTRDVATLVPSRAPAARDLFRLGALDAICGENLGADLAALVKSGFLRAEHADRVYRCPCGDARLHFRDACEHCRSTDMGVMNVLRHHCGHSAASGSFWKGEELVCPKCGEQLKVAGEDYEGPLDETRCRGCGKPARAGLTLATCAGCGETTQAERLVSDDARRYTLTENGRAAALSAAGETPVDPARRAALLAAWKKITTRAPKPIASFVRCTTAARGADLDALLEATVRGTDVALRVGPNTFVALLDGASREGAQRFVARITGALRKEGEPAPASSAEIHCFPEEQAAIDAALQALEG